MKFHSWRKRRYRPARFIGESLQCRHSVTTQPLEIQIHWMPGIAVQNSASYCGIAGTADPDPWMRLLHRQWRGQHFLERGEFTIKTPGILGPEFLHR